VPKHQLQNRRISGETLSVLHGINEPGRGHHFKAPVDADKKLRWNIRRLDGAELRTLDLSRNRAQLARRIDLGPDAPSRIPFDCGGVRSLTAFA